MELLDIARKESERNGYNFNCYSFTLYMTGASPILDWVSPDEMLDILERQFYEVSRVCVGDIIVLIDKSDPWEIIHAAVSIGDGRFHHKCGSSSLRENDTIAQIRKIYPGTTEIRAFRPRCSVRRKSA